MLDQSNGVGAVFGSPLRLLDTTSKSTGAEQVCGVWLSTMSGFTNERCGGVVWVSEGTTGDVCTEPSTVCVKVVDFGVVVGTPDRVVGVRVGVAGVDGVCVGVSDVKGVSGVGVDFEGEGVGKDEERKGPTSVDKTLVAGRGARLARVPPSPVSHFKGNSNGFEPTNTAPERNSAPKFAIELDSLLPAT